MKVVGKNAELFSIAKVRLSGKKEEAFPHIEHLGWWSLYCRPNTHLNANKVNVFCSS